MAKKKAAENATVIDTTSVPVKPMSPIDMYWTARLKDLKVALEENNFEVFIAENTLDAGTVFLEQILPTLQGAQTVSFGGSMTLVGTGVVDAVRANPALEVIDTFDSSLSREEVLARRRLSLLADIFLTGTNAVTECGKLVNLDMIGNRVGGINYGPTHVVLFIGRNKIVDTVQDAMSRIKEYVAPVNAMRLNKKTPCRQTARCMDCSSPDRICNMWSITEKSFPKGRIRIVLINEDAGF